MSIQYPLLEGLSDPFAIQSMNPDEWEQLAHEVRMRINEVVQETGGHLGPNLGTVEIIIACHAVFHLCVDKLVFDVGHQAYPHKIITGRHSYFNTLRQKGGISGYPHQGESPYDVYRGGHASTAISTALGLLRGLRMSEKTKNSRVIALVGDGSLTGGMAFEGLNSTGSLKENLIVILNDNTMSISPTVGALSKAFNKIRHKKFYSNFKTELIKFVKKIPKIGSKLEESVQLFLDEATNPHESQSDLYNLRI